VREELFVKPLYMWIIRGDYPGKAVPELMKLVAEAVYGREIELIRSGICPFCGRRYRKILQHLVGKSRKVGSCSSQFMSMVVDIIRAYMSLKEKIVKSSSAYVVFGRRFKHIHDARIYAVNQVYGDPKVKK